MAAWERIADKGPYEVEVNEKRGSRYRLPDWYNRDGEKSWKTGSPPEEKFKTPHPIPEGRERELLVILQEECAEVILHTSKALRFGLENGYPDRPDTNRVDINAECGHVLCMIDMLCEAGILKASGMNLERAHKRRRVEQHLQSEDPR